MTQIASHRGGAALWPENSATAFRETAQLDVEQIEFDVQRSADGVPVIFHDTDLDRVTDGTGPLAARTLAELKALTIFNGGGQILTLEEGLDLIEPTHLVPRCEIKPGPGLVPYPGLVAQTLDAFAARGMTGRTVITSFHLPTLGAALAQADGLRDVIWLVADPVLRLTSPRHVAHLARLEGVPSVSPRHTLLRDGTLEALRGEGLSVGAFAVLEDEAIAWAFAAGLDVFTTDRPDAALAIRAHLQSGSPTEAHDRAQ
ncbi:MAG: glycerophosphodiester phosphodiesterase family protein [Pseudomonadota bacterium]